MIRRFPRVAEFSGWDKKFEKIFYVHWRLCCAEYRVPNLDCISCIESILCHDIEL